MTPQPRGAGITGKINGDTLAARRAHPYVIGQARRIVLRLIALHGPEIVAIEAPYLIPTLRAEVLSTLTYEIHERARETGANVVRLRPEEVCEEITGNPEATKYEVAQRIGRGAVP